MKKWLLAPCLWLAIFGSAYAEDPVVPSADPSAANPSTNTVPDAAQPVPAAPGHHKWYIGITYELGSVDTKDSNDPYYASQGYTFSRGCCLHGTAGLKFFAGYPVSDNLDAEFGFALTSTYKSTTYQDLFGANTIYSNRTTDTGALYAAALLRPSSESWHDWFLKLGVHYSSYDVSRDVTGSGPAPNLSTIMAGDKLPADGNINGFGTLAGVGVDWGDRVSLKYRLELTHYIRIGGGPYVGTLLSFGVTYRFY